MANDGKKEKEDSLGRKVARISLIFIFFSLLFGAFAGFTAMGKAAVVAGTVHAGHELGAFNEGGKGKD